MTRHAEGDAAMPQSPELPPLPLTYLTRPPQQPSALGEKPPLLFLLHGVGSNERDLFALAPSLPPEFRIVSLRAPLTRAPGSYAWFDVTFLPSGFRINPEQLERSRDLVLDVVREAARVFDADPARMYLLGFSQGAIVSLTTALTWPEPLAGVVALAGRIPPEAEPWVVAPERMRGLPILLAHGRLDSVIPYDWAERARGVLGRQGVALTFNPYETEHRISPDMLADVIAWLEARLLAPRWQPYQPG
jgi:phospholipase/carboxylesterase